MKTVCCICRRHRVDDLVWVMAPPAAEKTPEPVSHGYCPDCFRIMMAKTMRHRLLRRRPETPG